MEVSVLTRKATFWENISNPKRIAFALISIASHTMVSLRVLSAIMAVDLALHMYLVIMQVLRQIPSVDQRALSQVNIIESYLFKASPDVQLAFQAALTGFFFLLIVTFVVIALKTHSLSTMGALPGVKRAMTVIYVLLMTVLQIPLIEIIVAPAFFRREYQLTTDQQVIQQLTWLFAIVNGILFLGISTLLQKLFIIRIPSQTIPWAASNSQLHSMKILNKVLLVVSHLYITTVPGQEKFLYLPIPTLFLFAVTGFMRIMIIPHYQKAVDWLTRLTELLTGSLLLVLIVCQLMPEQSEGNGDLGLGLLVGFVTLPSIVALAVVLDYQRQRNIWSKLERGELKLEFEYEHALYLLIQRISTAMRNDTLHSTEALGDILYLVEVHQRECQTPLCPCEKHQILQILLNKGYLHHQKRLIITDEEIALLNSTCVDPFIKTDKKPPTAKALTVFQNYNFYQIQRLATPEVDTTQLQKTIKFNDSAKVLEGHKQHDVPTKKSTDTFFQVSVSIPKLKLTFLNQFCELFFADARRRFPDSKRLFFQYAYFTLQCCHNRFMTETLLRNFETGTSGHKEDKNGWVEQVSIMINELQTIMEIEKMEESKGGSWSLGEDEEMHGSSDFQQPWGVQYLANGKASNDLNSKPTGQYSALEMFDPEYFVLMSELTSKFYGAVENLASSVQSFWKLIQSDTLDVDTAHKESRYVADIIATVYKVFKEIEESTESGNTGTGRGSTDFQVIYTFAQIQRLLLNDMMQYELYLQKMNSQREMMRLIHNNQLNVSKGPEDTGFMIVRGEDRYFGKVILANQVFRRSLGYSSKELEHMKIHQFMPNLIKNWHQSFVEDFSRNGGSHNGILNKTTCVFIKLKTGYVTPAMINVRFQYSKEYDFAFVCFVSFMKEIQVAHSAGTNKTKLNEILFFLCEDSEGKIIDFSESCYKQLGISQSLMQGTGGESDNQAFQGLTVEDICPSLSFSRIKDIRDQADNLFSGASGGLSSIVEEIVELDINVLESLKHKNSLGQGTSGETKKSKNPNYQKALCQVFREVYGANKDKCMNIIALVLIDQIAMREYLHDQKKSRRDQRNRRDARLAQKSILSGEIKKGEKGDTRGGNSISGSVLDSGSGSQSRTGSSQTSTLKQMYQTTEGQTSSTLRLITQLISIVFVLLLVVSSINLILSLSQNQRLQQEIFTVKQSYDRVARQVQARQLLRGMINMANGYESMTTQIGDGDRFSLFQKEFERQVINLKQIHDYLDTDDFEYSDKFRAYIENKKAVDLVYLDPFNQPMTEYQSYSYALNLFIQRASSVAGWNMTRFRGNIRSLTLQGPPSTSYPPNDDERTLYFLIKACQGTLRGMGKNISTYYREETTEHALSVAEKTQITIIVSIVSIVIVTVIISPIICRIEERKYLGLKFFLSVEHEHLAELDMQISEFFQLAFQDASVHTGTTHQESMVIKDKKRLSLLQGQSQAFYQDFSSKDNGAAAAGIQSSSRSSSNNVVQAEDDYFRSSSSSSAAESKGGGGITATPSQYFEEQQLNKEASQKQLWAASGDGESAGRGGLKRRRTRQLIEAASNMPEGESMRKLNESQKDGQQVDEESESEMSAEEEAKKAKEQQGEYLQMRAEIQKQKIENVNHILKREKIKTVIEVVLLAVILCSYFIAGYFFSVNSFAQTPAILMDLDTIYFQDITLDSLMAFVREDYFFNSSIPSEDLHIMSGTEVFLERSSHRAMSYLELRKNIPAVFGDISDYIQALETNQLCNLTFQDQPEKVRTCQKIYKGVLSKGLAYTINVIVSHFRNLNLQFLSAQPARNISFIANALKDPDTCELIELQQFILSDLILHLKNRVTNSTADYYNRLINQYKGLYSAFIVLMTALFLGYLIFGYSHIKDTMWKTNLTLKIMPLDFIPRHCLPELKAFFRY